MKAPERLYLSENIYSTYLYQVPDPDDKTAVEYTRTDAVIKKIENWLKDNAGDYVVHHWNETTLDTMSLIEDIKEYMKEN